jgi:hypothetical protein
MRYIMNDGDNDDCVALNPVNGFVGQTQNPEFADIGHDAGASEAGKILQVEDALHGGRRRRICPWNLARAGNADLCYGEATTQRCALLLKRIEGCFRKLSQSLPPHVAAKVRVLPGALPHRVPLRKGT